MAEAAYALWLDAVPAAVLLQQDERIVFANRAAAALTGCSQAELVGMQVAQVVHDGLLTTCSGSVLPVELLRSELDDAGVSYTLLTIQTPARLYRAAVEDGIDSFFLLHVQRDTDKRIVDAVCIDVNERALQQTQFSREQLIGRPVSALFKDSPLTAEFSEFLGAMQQGAPLYMEREIRGTALKDGWYQLQIVPLGDDKVALFGRNVTERVEAEVVAQKLSAELEQQARMLDEILATTPDSFILFDRAGRYLYVNRRGLEHSGLTNEQVVGKTWRELGFPEETGLLFEQRLEQVFTTGQPITFEEQFPTIGGLHDFLTTLTPIHDKDGQTILMLNTIHDITERKQAEVEQRKLAAELQQQARVFDEVLSTTPDTFLMFDRENRFLYASPSALRNTDLKPSQVVGKTWRELGFPAENGEKAERMVAQVFATRQPSVIEELFPTVGGLRHFESIFTPLHDQTDSVAAVVVTSRDITERKLAEEALRESQKLLTSIFETALAGIAVFDENGRFVQVNRTFCDIYGYAPAELIGKPFAPLIVPPETILEVTERFERSVRGSGEYISTVEVQRRDGQRLEITVYSSVLVREDGQHYLVSVILDVSEQKRTQQALQESEQRLTGIFNSMQDTVWSLRAGTHDLLTINSAIETLSGYSAAQFLANGALLIDIVYPDDRERFVEALRHIEHETRVDMEYRIVRRDGIVRWTHNRFWLANGAEGGRIDGIMSDITDRRQATEQAVALALERERVVILSDFVRDVSHEFRTPLSVINTHLYLIEKVADPLKQAQYIEGIKEQAERILNLVESLITMSRLDSSNEPQFVRLDLNRLLAVVQMNVDSSLRQKVIGFNLDLSPDPLNVRGDMNELVTAISAVFDNAVRYTQPGGQIAVRSYRRGDEVVVDVRDTGIGIAPEELPHIFERFYRADRARSERGFGLGLPIARKIVELHSGRIEVESVPEQGSLFRLIFPEDHQSPSARIGL